MRRAVAFKSHAFESTETTPRNTDMRLTTKGRFAVTAMIDLALRQDNGPVTLAAISQRQHF